MPALVEFSKDILYSIYFAFFLLRMYLGDHSISIDMELPPFKWSC